MLNHKFLLHPILSTIRWGTRGGYRLLDFYSSVAGTTKLTQGKLLLISRIIFKWVLTLMGYIRNFSKIKGPLCSTDFLNIGEFTILKNAGVIMDHHLTFYKM